MPYLGLGREEFCRVPDMSFGGNRKQWDGRSERGTDQHDTVRGIGQDSRGITDCIRWEPGGSREGSPEATNPLVNAQRKPCQP